LIRVKGVYAHLDCLLAGIERLRAAGLDGFTVVAPLPRHEIEEMIYQGQPSPVRWWTLAGAVFGVTFGFLLPALTHAEWPMINPGGKPVISLPAFAIIMFECTILFGSIATLCGMVFHAGLPSFGLDKAIADPRFTDDQFGIVFTKADVGMVDRIKDILTRSGAVEVTSGDATIYEVPNV
jgi:hypothetical protein